MFNKIRGFFKKLKKNEKGFTLVELMVVLIVIGIVGGYAVSEVGFIETDARNQALNNLANEIQNDLRIQSRQKGGYSFLESEIDDLTYGALQDITRSSLPDEEAFLNTEGINLSEGDVPLDESSLVLESDNYGYVIGFRSSIVADNGDTTRIVAFGDRGVEYTNDQDLSGINWDRVTRTDYTINF